MSTWNHELTDLTDFERDIATAAVAVDALWGGDYRDPTGAAHLLVDAYCSGKEKPPIFPKGLRELFLQQGIGVTDPEAVRAFIAANAIEKRLGRVRDYASVEDRWRGEFLLHLVDLLDVQLRLRTSMVGLADEVPDAVAYRAAFGRDPEPLDPREAIDTLERRLAAVGLMRTNTQTLTNLVDTWRQREPLTLDQMESEWEPLSQRLVAVARNRIYPFLPEWVTEIPPESVDFGVTREDVHYSGINLAKHTIKRDGQPDYHTFIRISDKVQLHRASYGTWLVAHEGMPGHGLHLPIMHGLYARGEYGFETTLMILCSPLATLAEGLACSTMRLLYGNDLEQHLNPDELVALALDELNVIGRNNVVVRYIHGERNPAALSNFLREEYCFSDVDAEKYVNKWLFHPRMGKLMGIMYLPSYGVGTDLVHRAIETYGREAVIPVVYGTKGQVDGINFMERMKTINSRTDS